MLARMKKRWFTPRMLGVLLAKLILSGATALAAQTIPCQKIQTHHCIIVNPSLPR